MQNTKKDGIVTSFNPKTGYGFINATDDNTSYFVHFSDLNMEGFKKLKKRQAVKFEIEVTGKDCNKAINVDLVED